MKNYQVVQYKNAEFYGIVSGLGRNLNTWDSTHTKRTAQRYAKVLREAYKNDVGVTFKVETVN